MNVPLFYKYITNQKINQYNLFKMYQVEKIVACRINKKGKKQYNVKWYGYDSSQNTWEPEKNLVNVQQLLQEFNKRQGKDDYNANKLKNLKSTAKPNLSQANDEQQAVYEESDQQISNNQILDEDENQEPDKSGSVTGLKNLSIFPPERKSKRGRQKNLERANAQKSEKTNRKQIRILGMSQLQKENFVYKIQVDGKTEWVKRSYLIPQYMLQLILFYESAILFKKD